MESTQTVKCMKVKGKCLVWAVLVVKNLLFPSQNYARFLKYFFIYKNTFVGADNIFASLFSAKTHRISPGFGS